MLDPHDPTTQQDPFPTYRALREQAPVHRMPDGSVVVSRHADVVRLLSDPAVSSAQEAGAAGAPVAALADHSRAVMIASDPPVHTRRRGAVAPHLAPAEIRPFAAAVSTHVEELVAGLPTDEPVDLVPALTARVPARTLLDMLGMERADEHAVLGWTSAFSDGISPWAGPDGEARAGRALAELRDHLRPLLAERGSHPSDDLLTALAEDPHLDGDEALQQAVLLCTAGLDTTADLLASAAVAVASDPELWAAVVAEPDALVPAVVEETLRFESPVPFLMRRLAAPVTVAGTELDAGTPLLLAIGAANRDPAVFTEPERFDPGRMLRGERRHLSFGSGPHRCLGAPLARVQGAAVLHALARQRPSLQLVDPARARPRLFLRGPEAVVVRAA